MGTLTNAQLAAELARGFESVHNSTGGSYDTRPLLWANAMSRVLPVPYRMSYGDQRRDEEYGGNAERVLTMLTNAKPGAARVETQMLDGYLTVADEVFTKTGPDCWECEDLTVCAEEL